MFNHSDPFLKLFCYVMVIEAFGWDSIKQVFQEYRDEGDISYDSSNAGRTSVWVKKISLIVDRDLRPFYMKWSWPIDQLVNDPELDSLEAWSG